MDKRNLLITVLIIITAASLGTAIFYYNQAKNQNQSQAEPANTTQSAQNPANSETPSGTATSEQKNTPAGSEQASSVGTSSSQGASSSIGSSTGSTSSNSGGGETAGSQASPAQNSLQAQIEEKYTARLASVGSSYEGRLNGLVGSAFSEYQAAKKADPNADVSQIANKYYAAGQALQAECDNKMYAIIDAFESELQANSLPVHAAERARAAYEATKSDRAGQILSSKP